MNQSKHSRFNSPPKMIMGTPPDARTKPIYKYLLWALLLIFVCGTTLYLIKYQRQKASSLVVNASGPKIGTTSPGTTNQLPDGNSLAKENTSLKSVPQTQEENQSSSSKFSKKAHVFSQENEVPLSTLSTAEKSFDTKSHLPKVVSPAPYTLYFGLKDARISSKAFQAIKELFEIIKDKNGRLFIEGHTCALGTEESNTSLSEERARRVKKVFRQLGLRTNIRISLFAFGESQPVSPNETEAGRQKNRRVVLRFIPDKKVEPSG